IVKPELLITVNRLDLLRDYNEPVKDFDKDEKTMKLAKDVNDFSNLTKNFVIIQPHFTLALKGQYDGEEAAKNLAYKLAKKLPLGNGTKPRNMVEKQVIPAWSKLKHAAKSCQNCRTIEILDLFCNATECQLFDKQNNYAYFCDGSHFTEHAASKMINLLKTEFDKSVF
uniref:SGNH domain-containing protein n=1 Tax=Panagrolaimus sp. JU765 TaxID=591449 RepID=A0AC34R986_9BILA